MAPCAGGDISTMIRLSSFTPRMWLILAHDLIATTAAVVVSFFIRFEEAGLAERWQPLVMVLLGVFVLYAGVVYVVLGLYKAKWRFTSLPDLYSIVRASTVLAVTLLALDYILLAPNVYGTFFFGKITIVLYWLLQIAFLSGPRIAYRYFRYTRTLQHAKEGGSTPILVVGRTADADVLLRAIESGAVTKVLAGRHPVAVARRSRAGHPRGVRARRPRRPRGRRRRSARSRHECGAARADAERARAGGQSRNHPDARKAARAHHQPTAVARRRRRGAAARSGQCRGPAAAAAACRIDYRRLERLREGASRSS